MQVECMSARPCTLGLTLQDCEPQCLSQTQLRGDTATYLARDSPLDKKLRCYTAGVGVEGESWLPCH